MFYEIQAGAFVSTDFFDSEASPARNVEKYEIEVLVNDTGSSFINGVSYPRSSFNFLFSKEGDIRFSTGMFKSIYLKFKCDDKEICSFLNLVPSVAIFTNVDEISKLIMEISVLSDEPADKIIAYSKILSVISLVYINFKNTKNSQRKTDFKYIEQIIKAKGYIEDNYSSKINLSTLSKITFLSKNFFRVKFKDIIGVSPHEYLTKVRISNAKNLLENTNTPIVDIALLCGFESQSYLNYIFKNETGISPFAYRKYNKKDIP